MCEQSIHQFPATLAVKFEKYMQLASQRIGMQQLFGCVCCLHLVAYLHWEIRKDLYLAWIDAQIGTLAKNAG